MARSGSLSPCHVKQAPAATAAFRDELEQSLAKLDLPKDRPVKIWVADEARFGLHTQSRRCWALRGQRVVLAREHRHEWEYVYGAVEVVEGFWDQTQDVTSNRHFADLDQLEEALTQALGSFWQTPTRVLSLDHHWLHDQANATA